MTSLTPTAPRTAWPQHAASSLDESQRRLSQAFETALRLPCDDHTPFIIFSDHHRGDRSKLDAFAPNRHLFIQALQHYYDHGYTYIEAGDGDELWKGWRFAAIEAANDDVFELLHRFHRAGRLHLLFGNHEALPGGYLLDKGGLPLREAVVLERRRAGQRIFVTHGHQADPSNNRRLRFNRLVVQHLWTPLQAAGLASLAGPAQPIAFQAYAAVDLRIEGWAAAHRQLTISGHTHRPVMARPGAAPYFNTGACLFPGQITGIEIVGGCIQLVRWTSHVGRSNEAVRRHAVTPAIPLSSYH